MLSFRSRDLRCFCILKRRFYFTFLIVPLFFIERDSPSFLKRKYPNLYQYSGNEIKGELLELLKNPALVAPFVCREQCTVDNMKVYRWEVAVVSD